MKNRIIFCSSLIVFSLLILAGCKKDPGKGGLSSITGRVYAYDYDKSGNLKSEGYLGDARVAINIQGEPYPLEDQHTKYDGSYEFRELRKGNYEVYVFYDCDTGHLGQCYSIQQVQIDSKKGTVTVPDLIVNM